MQPNRTQVSYLAALALVFACLAAVTPAYASGREKVLYDFYGNTEQVTNPQGSLVADATGNLYGTSNLGSKNSNGVVYELVRGANGTWSDQVIYSFTGGSDGSYPNGNLIFDAAGNIYGTANQGGDYGVGTVFELSPGSVGTWIETTLYSFNYNNGTDGIYPATGLIFDAAGNLYGGTMFGGNYQDPYCAAGCGAIFKLTHNPDGSWTEATLYGLLFIDGYEIFSNLTFDAAGNLWGMATWGGTGVCYQDGSNSGCGTVFQLAPQPDGSWMFHRIYSFQGGTDGSDPVRDGNLVFDSQGNIYGATSTGGNQGCSNRYYTGCGTVFQMTPQPNGEWTETVLHVFGNAAGDGTRPHAVAFDAAGNLYGAAEGTGGYGFGNFFELKPNRKGQWTYKTLYNFGGFYGDAQYPWTTPVRGADGYLYGLARLVGAYGSIYRIKP